jgi:hypothetical protein
MLENWIDEVARIAGTVPNGRNGFIAAYKLFAEPKIPETLTVFPCAITYTESVVMQMPDSGPNVDTWLGVTEFHLAAGTKKTDLPSMHRFFHRIRVAWAADRTLGGRVQYCKLNVEGPSIEGPIVFNPNTEIATQGLLVHWVVRERLS